MALPRCGVHRLRGELVGPQGGGASGGGGSQGVGAVQRGGRGAVTGGGALLRLVLDERRGKKRKSGRLQVEGRDRSHPQTPENKAPPTWRSGVVGEAKFTSWKPSRFSALL